MLSQEELDKLLEDGPEGIEAAQAGTQPSQDAEQQASSNGPLNQDELDKLLEEGADATEEADGAEDVDWGDAFAEAAAGGDAAAAKAVSEGAVGPMEEPSPPPSPPASQPSFDEFDRKGPTEVPTGKPDLDFILDLPLEISVELGRSRLQIRDLLQLGQGSVIELEKMAGEPAEIFVNQKLMAKGEVVVVNEKFGIRLSEIISPADRVKNLGGRF